MKKKFLAISMMVPLLLLSVLSYSVVNVNAQDQATVTILSGLGGSTSPSAGTYTYDAGESISLNATGQTNYAFLYWLIQTDSSSTNNYNNPMSLTVTAGGNYTIQPVFNPVATATLGYNPATTTINPSDGIVVVLSAVGGTTNPPPGYYVITNLTETVLTAVPDSGWEFSNWIISGSPIEEGSHGGYPFTATPTDNPYTVGHGEGNHYNYQPVFRPVGSEETMPSPTATEPTTTIMGLSMEYIIIIALVAIIIVILIVFGVYAGRRRH